MTQIPGYTDMDAERWVPEPAKKSYRTAFERDRARVLHSSALRRLSAKTQVVAPTQDDFVRNRLTHSLEVAQVGRELGAALGCDPDVVDTACLAHDLGHPPFGHNGEKALDKLAAEIGGFEGNAQTLRLLTRLETKTFRHNGHSAGLNLSRASLDAACKYPWLRADAPQVDGKTTRKFGVYADDAPVFDWLRSVPEAREAVVCMEGQVMDLADDISYSVHDVEDAIVGGNLQLRWLKKDAARTRALQVTKDWYLPATADQDIEAALRRLEQSQEWVAHFDGSRRSMAGLKDMTSQFIGRFAAAAMDATRARYGTGHLTRYNASLIVPEETEHEIAVMKGIAASYVMTSEGRQPLYDQQRTLLAELVELLLETGRDNLEPIFAADWEDAADADAQLRVVIDQVASLTDVSATQWHSYLVKGEAPDATLF
ncbi:deoxyguanosinetriphosphate triphosphohydrolase [Glutamicibacter protophormiae]|uniref:deoxyguanosinetriphosphate triphosphohydrolase n=1 Tax=Glutamicibacter protophormiae TaxID=37930 RepID=UPI002A81EDA9|nr:deoxyguanosinetriphosphate triphosphohydrolase [Glutamicibacter protophormiae]WPR65675.1 deoxyguanosinetriphosphate triphosphohydrolase [Glutamicibacter protophormiae]WPR69172.1 deoxyguanosinetriphosphate triphosphohydrolase [Glutamicibacter protophormiae]